MKKTYLEKLNASEKEGNVGEKELKILKYVWYLFKIELLPYKYLPLHYNIFLLYSIVFLSVSAIVLLVLMMYSFTESIDIAIEIYNNIKYKFFNIIALGSSIWLILLILFKKKINWCSFSEICWKENHTTCMTKRTNTALIAFCIIIIIINIFMFEDRYVIFMMNLIFLTVIYETFMVLSRFESVKNWLKMPAIDISYSIKEEKEISNIGFKNTEMVKLYSLSVKYSYKIKEKIYYSSQVYIDEPRDGQLFKSRNRYKIEQWILDNKNHIKDVYVNPDILNEAVIFREVLLFSYIGKVFVAVGSLLMIYIVNNHIDLSYYF